MYCGIICRDAVIIKVFDKISRRSGATQRKRRLAARHVAAAVSLKYFSGDTVDDKRMSTLLSYLVWLLLSRIAYVYRISGTIALSKA